MNDRDDTRTADVREARRRLAILLGESPAVRARDAGRRAVKPSKAEIADPEYYAWRECMKARRT